MTDTHDRRVFMDHRVEMDGDRFERCTFDGCVVVLEKHEAAHVRNCHFNDCRFEGGGWYRPGSKLPVWAD